MGFSSLARNKGFHNWVSPLLMRIAEKGTNAISVTHFSLPFYFFSQKRIKMYRAQDMIEEVNAAGFGFKSAREFLEHISNDRLKGVRASARKLFYNLGMVVSREIVIIMFFPPFF